MRDSIRVVMRYSGQCHVEYYCGKGMTVFFPWKRGLKVEQIEQQYDGMQMKGHRFEDWVQAETGMEVLKAQHPEFELWSQGIHARSGVACADCHMPYKREGAMKVSEHRVKSPLLMVNRSCETCHPYGEQEIKARVEAIQDRHFALLTRAGQAAVAMLDAIVAVRKTHDDRNRPQAQARARQALAGDAGFARLGAEEQRRRLDAETNGRLLAMWRQAVEKDPKLAELGELQRAAQWRLDFVAAENSMGFHAPQEMARILGESIDFSRQAQVKAVAFPGGAIPPPLPPESIPAPAKPRFQSSRGGCSGTWDSGRPEPFDKLRAGGVEGPSTPLRYARAERIPNRTADGPPEEVRAFAHRRRALARTLARGMLTLTRPWAPGVGVVGDGDVAVVARRSQKELGRLVLVLAPVARRIRSGRMLRWAARDGLPLRTFTPPPGKSEPEGCPQGQETGSQLRPMPASEPGPGDPPEVWHASRSVVGHIGAPSSQNIHEHTEVVRELAGIHVKGANDIARRHRNPQCRMGNHRQKLHQDGRHREGGNDPTRAPRGDEDAEPE
jgi:hypothetical protein